MQRKFSKSATLNQVLNEIKAEGCQEITRILPYPKCVIVEWEGK